MNKICGIYKITSPTGRVYIGSSVDIIKNRFSNYKNSGTQQGLKRQPLLRRSIEKHGVENHTFEIIEECLEEDLNCRERHWQDFYDVLNGGLNCVLVECNNMKRVWSEEQKDKFRGENNPFYGKTHTEEVIKILKSKIGDKNHFYGKHHSEESIALIKKSVHKQGADSENSKMVVSLYYNILFDCVNCAADELGIGRSTMIVYMKGGRFRNRYLFMYLCDYEKYSKYINLIGNTIELKRLELSEDDYKEMVDFFKSKRLII